MSDADPKVVYRGVWTDPGGARYAECQLILCLLQTRRAHELAFTERSRSSTSSLAHRTRQKEEITEIAYSDVVYFAPGENWHGAAPGSPHIPTSP